MHPPLHIFHTRESGLYLLHEPVPNDGTITEMRALGFLSDRDFELLQRNQVDMFMTSMYLFFAVFRLDNVSGIYQLIHGPEMATHTISDPAIAQNLQWLVRAGDKIGAVVPESCLNGTNSPPFPCPSHFNLRVSDNRCYSGLHSLLNFISGDMELAELLDGIPIGQFVEEQVLLNVEARIRIAEAATIAPGMLCSSSV